MSSCALARDGRVMRVQAGDTSRAHGEQLPSAIATLLDHESLTLRDIDGYGVAIGPGSFTGLRVGIATMQGLAMATDKPLVGASGLDGLALLASPRSPADACVVTWIDAWRGDVFAAEYVERQASDDPIIAHPDELLDRLRKRATFFIGEGAARNADLIRAVCGSNASLADPISPLLAGAVATLATQVLLAGERPQPHAIRPLYVHRGGAALTPKSDTR